MGVEGAAVRDRGVLRLQVQGPAVASGRILVDDLVVLVRQVQTAIERIALVLRGEQGMRRGRRPADIERLTRLELVALESGSVVMVLDFRRDQLQLEGMDPGVEAAWRLVDGLVALDQREELPPGWDPGVVVAFREATSLFRRGIERVEISLGIDGCWRSACLEAVDAERFARLATRRVSNRRTVEGRLLMADFKEWATRCRVHPPMGPPVECTFDEAHRQAVLDALTKYVRVTGEAEIDPETSRIKRLAIADLEILDWEGAEETTPSFWEPIPTEGLAVMQRVKPVTHVEELAADIWESPEEVEAFLADVYAARTGDRDFRGG